MARGFGSTLGSGTTDSVVGSALPANMTTFTLFVVAYRQGDGGNSVGRIANNNGIDWRNNGLNNSYDITCTFSTTTGVWTVPRPAISTFTYECVSYDGSSTANNPTWIRGGVSQTVTRNTAPSGTLSANSGAVTIGNFSVSGRVWDGILAEFALWNRKLTNDEMIAHTKGYCPSQNPIGLVMYVPLLRTPRNLIDNTPLTVTGGLIANHTLMRFNIPPHITILPAASIPATGWGQLLDSRRNRLVVTQ